MIFSTLGWSQPFDLLDYFYSLHPTSWVPARISSTSHDEFQLIRPDGEFAAVVAGRLRFEAEEGGDWPVVGDWVAALPNDDGPWVIQKILPRSNSLYRGLAERGEADQLIAANVDVALIVTALDHDLSLRRVERYIYLAKASKVRPVLAFNKLDLHPDVSNLVEAIASLGCESHMISAATGLGVPALTGAIGARQTVVLLGSSGVGKSTLVNQLLGRELQRTSSVRECDSKGRHTTTNRQLIPMPQGWVLIDMPGIREVGLPSSGEDAGSSVFPEIERLAQQCRFPDCRHVEEPGCRVLEAVEIGQVDGKRLESYRKLERERAYQLSRGDKKAEAENKARWKVIHKAQKEHYKGPKYL